MRFLGRSDRRFGVSGEDAPCLFGFGFSCAIIRWFSCGRIACHWAAQAE
jgi:hypothetical protein